MNDVVKRIDAALSRWDSAGKIRLHAGEMTAQEMRAAKAVLGGMAAGVREAILDETILVWLPIAQAPRDGTIVDLWIVDGKGRGRRHADCSFDTDPEAMCWKDANWEIVDHCEAKRPWFRPHHATHFMRIIGPTKK